MTSAALKENYYALIISIVAGKDIDSTLRIMDIYPPQSQPIKPVENKYSHCAEFCYFMVKVCGFSKTLTMKGLGTKDSRLVNAALIFLKSGYDGVKDYYDGTRHKYKKEERRKKRERAYIDKKRGH